jgi:transcriptional regulator with XRE-family HTH domain
MIRKDKKLTLDDVGSMTGMKESYLSRLENGKHDIKLSTFEKIVESYGYEISIVPKEEE